MNYFGSTRSFGSVDPMWAPAAAAAASVVALGSTCAGTGFFTLPNQKMPTAEARATAARTGRIGKPRCLKHLGL